MGLSKMGIDIEYLSIPDRNYLMKIENIDLYEKDEIFKIIDEIDNVKNIKMFNKDYFKENIYYINETIYILKTTLIYLLGILDDNEHIEIDLSYQHGIESGVDLGFFYHVLIVKTLNEEEYNKDDKDNIIFDAMFEKYNNKFFDDIIGIAGIDNFSDANIIIHITTEKKEE